MPRTGIETLPVELLLHVFDYLDSASPSELKIRREPSLELTRSATQTLKEISCVSKCWRRVVLPLLFRHARLRLDIPRQDKWSRCPACSDAILERTSETWTNGYDAEAVHADMVAAFKSRPRTTTVSTSSANMSTTRENFEQPDEASTAGWAWRFHHVLQDFCEFIQTENLASSISSFCLFSGRTMEGKLGRFPHKSAARDWRYPAGAAFWQQLLAVIDPGRVIVLAPPTELACLTNAAIDTFGDWAFGDMDYHILELQQTRSGLCASTDLVEYAKLQPFPERYPAFAPSSLLYQRGWTHVTLNEGSFLKAYGTYEYFERGPPSLVYSIKDCFAKLTSSGRNLSGINALPFLRSFAYTAIFPFSDHADFFELLPHLEEIDLQYAPDPRFRLLDDKERIGKAELSDCWQELLSAYHEIATAIASFRMSQAKFPKLKRFICRDSQIPALRDELDEIFVPLCMPVWVEEEDRGVFTRGAMSPRRPEMDSFD